jgi:hypothetical protein
VKPAGPPTLFVIDDDAACACGAQGCATGSNDEWKSPADPDGLHDEGVRTEPDRGSRHWEGKASSSSGRTGTGGE